MTVITGLDRRVLVIDECELIASGLQLALSSGLLDVRAVTGPSSGDVLAHARSFEPQCVLMDTYLGAALGCAIDLIGPLSSIGAQVIMLTTERRRMVLAEYVAAGATGWIDKGATLDEIDSILCRVFAGEQLLGRTDRATLLEELRLHRSNSRCVTATLEKLTPREALVLGALIDGLNAEEMAEAHFVALNTVRSQISSVLHKLGVRSQLAAVAIAGPHRHLLPCEPGGGTERRRSRHPSEPGLAPVRT